MFDEDSRGRHPVRSSRFAGFWGGALAVLVACGGKSAEPTTPPDAVEDDGGGEAAEVSHVLVPERKFDEIARTFERKAPIVSRCYVAGVEAGEIEGSKRGQITVAVTVTTEGKASNVRVLRSTLGSKAAEACVVDKVAGWTFTDSLPKPVEHSYTYVLDRL